MYLRKRHSDRDGKNADQVLSWLRQATGVEPFVVRGLGAEDEVAKRLARPVRYLHFPQVFHGTNYIGGLVALKKHLLTQGPRERKAVAESNRIKGLKRRASEYAATKDIEKLCGEDAKKRQPDTVKFEMQRICELRKQPRLRRTLRRSWSLLPSSRIDVPGKDSE